MANTIATSAHNNVFSSMISQLHSQSTEQATMQKELENIKYKLEQASKILAQKDLLIGSLEIDLEHMIDQLVKIQHTRSDAKSSQQWIMRPVPGLNQ